MAVRKSVLYSFFVVIAALLIGFRSLEFGTDTQTYYNQYLNQKACYCIPNHFEPGIELLGFASSLMQLTPELYFSLLSFVQLLFIWVFTQQVAKTELENKKVIVLLTCIIVCTPFFINLQVNAVRQGLSLPFLLLSSLTLWRRQYLYSSLLFVVAFSFHASVVLYYPFIALLATPRNIVIPWLYMFFGLFLLYVFGFTEDIVKYFSQTFDLGIYEAVKNYSPHAVYKDGVRIDFAILTVLPIISFLFFSFHSKIIFRKYFFLIKLYIALSIPFWLFGWANYSNRYILPAWVILVLIAFLPLIGNISDGRYKVKALLSASCIFALLYYFRIFL